MTRLSSKFTAVAGLAATLLTLTSTSSLGLCGMISSSKRTLSTAQQVVETAEFPIASTEEQNTRGEESDWVTLFPLRVLYLQVKMRVIVAQVQVRVVKQRRRKGG